jgi:hypothetical protein
VVQLGAVLVEPARAGVVAAAVKVVSPHSSVPAVVVAEAEAVVVKAAGSDLLAAVKVAVVDGTVRRRLDGQHQNPLS